MMRYKIVNIVFLSIIFAFALNHVLKIVDVNDTNENRKLAEKPVLDINRLDYYPKQYESYLNDNFAGRKYFVEFYAWLNKTMFHKKTVNKKYLLGEDNFIFAMAKTMPVYTGKKTVSEKQLQNIITEFQLRQQYFDSIGVKMFIEVIPSKFKTHKDKLPSLIKRGEMNMGDRFIKAIQEETTIPIVDGENAMKECSPEHESYLKYDTHWTSYGCFAVTKVLLDTIHSYFPILQLLDTSNYSIETFEKDGGNMRWVAIDKTDPDFGYRIEPKTKTFRRIKGYVHEMEDFRYGQDRYCMRYASDHTEQPKVLFIRDSFSEFTLQFLPESFSEILYIWDDWRYMFNKEIVDIEKPDIVVYSLFEGYIDRILMSPSFVKPIQDENDVQ